MLGQRALDAAVGTLPVVGKGGTWWRAIADAYLTGLRARASKVLDHLQEAWRIVE